ncbi:heterogeneous nuclear ribonucleoprotein A1, A2/B1 homolog [Planococcus citri]|uniref:heterogeneous nuclear ribonucleoprotein A1, A2/B1 homolog n=1 Tax=Planococcus citri TaxID=170843 RepID=UPI0031F9900D
MVKTESNTRPAESFECEHLRKLFIGGLDHRTTDDKLKSHFEQWGEIVDVIVMKDPKTKRSRGFGFVTYSQPDMVDAAQAARPHKLDGKVVEPKRAVPRNQINTPESSATVKRIFIAGIKDDVTEEDVSSYFGKYGNIIKVSFVNDKETGKRKNFGFVEFDDYDSVDRICLDGSHSLKGNPIDVKKAVSKADMSKIQAKNASIEKAQQNSSNGTNWNAQNTSNMANRGTAGAPVNMSGGMMPNGYGPSPNWMENGWQNGGAMGMMPNMAGNGMNTMNPAMYSAGMASSNMNPMNMGMQGYGNMGPSPNMMGMGMTDPNMYNSAMANMTQAMASAPRMPNTCPQMPNNGTVSWNYGTGTTATNWPASNEAFGATYQQAYSGGPMRSGVATATAVRNTPYNTGATNPGAISSYPPNYNNGQTTTTSATSTTTATRQF